MPFPFTMNSNIFRIKRTATEENPSHNPRKKLRTNGAETADGALQRGNRAEDATEKNGADGTSSNSSFQPQPNLEPKLLDMPELWNILGLLGHMSCRPVTTITKTSPLCHIPFIYLVSGHTVIADFATHSASAKYFDAPF
jgi:hypothetical protein